MNAPDPPIVDVPGTWNDIAIDLARRGFYPAAILAQRRACDLAPERAVSWSNYGNMLRREGRMEEAVIAILRGLQLEPKNAAALYNYGVYHNDMGDPVNALICYEDALATDPGNHDWNFARACALLSLERWKEGFAGYEVRLDDRKFPWPMWDGSRLKEGQRLMIHAEQGAGDTIMFHRFVPAIKDRMFQVSAAGFHEPVDYIVDWPLAKLLGADPAGCLIKNDERCHAPLMSLPRILGITGITGEPYIERPRVRMGLSWPPGTRYKVGLVWQSKAGQKGKKVDERLHGISKSMPLELMLEICRIPGVALFGLQNDCTDIERLEAQHLIQDLGPRIHDFTDLAAFIWEMDVVVSVDTAPAHLAGAMGKPVVVCLHNRGAWHWGVSDRSPWYDSARIVAAEKQGTWPTDKIVAEVEACLRSLT